MKCIDSTDVLREELVENAGIMFVIAVSIVVWLMVFLIALKNMDKPPKKKDEDENTRLDV